MIKSILTVLTMLILTVGCAEQVSENVSAEAVTQNVRTVSVSEAVTMIAENKSLVILDVRSPEEFAEGHIKGALNINYHDDDFETRIAALDKSTPYLLHCHSGGRSGKTEKMLKSLGFTDVAHLKSGIAGWRKEGQPQVTE